MRGVSGRYSSVTCGKMPGRQVILYEKSREVRQKQKPEWWAHWNAARTRQNLPPLDGKETIWRLELRAGKTHLKDRWGIRTWADLDSKLGDLYARTLTDIRYTIPNPTDSERCRWPDHPLWQAARDTIATDLHEMTTGAEPDAVKPGLVTGCRHFSGFIFSNNYLPLFWSGWEFTGCFSGCGLRIMVGGLSWGLSTGEKSRRMRAVCCCVRWPVG
jgi:hypothetical protein